MEAWRLFRFVGSPASCFVDKHIDNVAKRAIIGSSTTVRKRDKPTYLCLLAAFSTNETKTKCIERG